MGWRSTLRRWWIRRWFWWLWQRWLHAAVVQPAGLRSAAGLWLEQQLLQWFWWLESVRRMAAIQRFPERLAASVPTATKPTAAVLWTNMPLAKAGCQGTIKTWCQQAATAAVLSCKPGHESGHGSNAHARDGSPTADQLRPIPKAAESVRVPERRQFTVFAGGVNGGQPTV